MTLYIPIWLLWAIGLLVGVPLALLILYLAWLGWAVLTQVIR
jgi:hypothetical protein